MWRWNCKKTKFEMNQDLIRSGVWEVVVVQEIHSSALSFVSIISRKLNAFIINLLMQLFMLQMHDSKFSSFMTLRWSVILSKGEEFAIKLKLFLGRVEEETEIWMVIGECWLKVWITKLLLLLKLSSNCKLNFLSFWFLRMKTL